MSVLARNRKESGLEVFHSFYKLRKELDNLIFRKFGYKGNPENGDFEFYMYIVNKEAIAIGNMLQECQKNLTMANSIYPTIIPECDERRILQDIALGLCFSIQQELQYILEVLPVDKNKYIRYQEYLDKVIFLLKGWRKLDNKIRGKIKEKESSV